VAAIFDIIYISTHNGHWADLSYWMIASGIIGGRIAAVFGLIDWLGISQGTRAKYMGLIHGLSNVVVLLLFIVSWFIRRLTPRRARNYDYDARMDRHSHSTLCQLARR
jgi:uncharacterized membrane protein